MWVTSNLWWERDDGDGEKEGKVKERGKSRSAGWRQWSGGKWGGRRWDWGEVVIQCVLPAGLVYFFMAWAEAGRREWSGC
jgi:N-glycosylation protein